MVTILLLAQVKSSASMLGRHPSSKSLTSRVSWYLVFCNCGCTARGVGANKIPYTKIIDFVSLAILMVFPVCEALQIPLCLHTTLILTWWLWWKAM